ncbi:kinase-like domain-containing protein [Aspergillus caelatus]|uniref:non-specific serine/threonine protein kinase n=1 Tax=Aspergillus caelatus TaxID=61420 RepID=A0A5N7AE25_9EURO|nr:kinase-like domain-containing protein [Aspergillus caelatus]KAE8367913.1 kinase-like domain-containing protein [Aspergillus caelatus]
MASIFYRPSRVPRQFSAWRTLFQRPASPVRELSRSPFTLESTEKFEEETLSWYQVIGKLGYGGHSTVWYNQGAMRTYGTFTNIQGKNIMMAVEDTAILANFEEEEKSSPSPRKVVGDRVIYASRKLRKTKQHGQPTLCDFGQARRGSNTYCGDIQPYIYRAPEVLLRMPWNEKVDIWNVGVLAWDLFQQGHLFCARDSDKQSSGAHHQAEMIAIMGLPPKDMVWSSVYATEFFDGEGNLEGEPQRLLLQFLHKMLRWKPEERESARELLDDPWLRSP